MAASATNCIIYVKSGAYLMCPCLFHSSFFIASPSRRPLYILSLRLQKFYFANVDFTLLVPIQLIPRTSMKIQIKTPDLKRQLDHQLLDMISPYLLRGLKLKLPLKRMNPPLNFPGLLKSQQRFYQSFTLEVLAALV